MDKNLSMAVTTTPTWDLGQCVEGWARAGLTQIGVTREKLEAYGPARGIKKIKDAGLKVASFHGIGGLYAKDGPQRFEQNIDIARRGLEWCSELQAGCGLIVGGPRGERTWEEAAKDYMDGVREILPEARERGIPLALEPLHPVRAQWMWLNTLKDACDLAAEMNDPMVGVVFDFWQHWWERGIERIIAENVSRIFVVHVSDYKLETIHLPDRAMLGEGIVPVARLLRALRDAGFQRTYEIEVITQDMERLGYDAGIARLIAAYERLRG